MMFYGPRVSIWDKYGAPLMAFIRDLADRGHDTNVMLLDLDSIGIRLDPRVPGSVGDVAGKARAVRLPPPAGEGWRLAFQQFDHGEMLAMWIRRNGPAPAAVSNDNPVKPPSRAFLEAAGLVAA